MKNILSIMFLTGISISSFGQRMTFEDWQNEANQNKRLIPLFGGLAKSKEELKSDQEFEKEVLKKFNTREEASNHMIDLGFQYLYRGDPRTAMYRFNQAYLLNKDNSNIYWGYGAIYMSFERFEMSRNQYDQGLKMDEENDNILIDYGTTYLAEFYSYYGKDPVKSEQLIDNAIEKLLSAYRINPKNSNSSYKLSICYLYKDNCAKAREYLRESESLGNPNITEAFRNELDEKCRSENLICTNVKTGKFKSTGEDETLIERATEFQIEENVKFGYKLKLKVTWLDDCTYQLEPVEDLLNPENTNLPKMVLTCTITEITDKGYVQISKSDIDPTRTKTELIKIE